ncbi:MAG: sensor histidine kinase [Chloroflexia bacterium]|nr:sensor histidine kinase [Chloroflexia bacterium]
MEAPRRKSMPANTESAASVREDERRRLARELHDGPAQALAAALFGVDLAMQAFDRGSATARDELLGVRALVRDALDDVRSLMAGLRPRLLEERGIVVALRSLAAMPPLWGTEVTVETRGMTDGERLRPDVELGLFRIAQEAVSNARRHGAANRVRVFLQARPTEVELLIEDDGRGMAIDAAKFTLNRGEGIPGMSERARLLGGDVTIESTPGSGTRISAVLPLAAAHADDDERLREAVS